MVQLWVYPPTEEKIISGASIVGCKVVGRWDNGANKKGQFDAGDELTFVRGTWGDVEGCQRAIDLGQKGCAEEVGFAVDPNDGFSGRSAKDNMKWDLVPIKVFAPEKFKHVCVSGDGRHVWATANDGQTFYRAGRVQDWINISGKMEQISVSNDGAHVWAVNSEGAVYYRNGFNGKWAKVDGNKKYISVSGDGQHVWGCNSANNIYYRDVGEGGGCGGKWIAVDGQLKCVDVSSDGSDVWGCDDAEDIFHRKATRSSADKWVKTRAIVAAVLDPNATAVEAVFPLLALTSASHHTIARANAAVAAGLVAELSLDGCAIDRRTLASACEFGRAGGVLRKVTVDGCDFLRSFDVSPAIRDLTLGGAFSWVDAFAKCAELGGRLCYAHELFSAPAGTDAVVEVPVAKPAVNATEGVVGADDNSFGMIDRLPTLDSDDGALADRTPLEEEAALGGNKCLVFPPLTGGTCWVPILDGENEWVQLGPGPEYGMCWGDTARKWTWGALGNAPPEWGLSSDADFQLDDGRLASQIKNHVYYVATVSDALSEA
jgi:hypothetical protein